MFYLPFDSIQPCIFQGIIWKVNHALLNSKNPTSVKLNILPKPRISRKTGNVGSKTNNQKSPRIKTDRTTARYFMRNLLKEIIAPCLQNCKHQLTKGGDGVIPMIIQINLWLCELCGHISQTAEVVLPYADPVVEAPSGGRWAYLSDKLACPECTQKHIQANGKLGPDDEWATAET